MSVYTTVRARVPRANRQRCTASRSTTSARDLLKIASCFSTSGRDSLGWTGSPIRSRASTRTSRSGLSSTKSVLGALASVCRVHAAWSAGGAHSCVPARRRLCWGVLTRVAHSFRVSAASMQGTHAPSMTELVPLVFATPLRLNAGMRARGWRARAHRTLRASHAGLLHHVALHLQPQCVG